MDGYALGSVDRREFRVIGEVPAGSVFSGEVQADEAIRIFTGSAVPDSAQAVIMQEWTQRSGDGLIIDRLIDKGMNIRPKGEQLEKGRLAMEAGHQLNSAGIGFLAGLGITEVEVYAPPKVAILITGDELVMPGNPLLPGKVYESNAVMLEAACQAITGEPPKVVFAPDQYEETVEVLASLLNEYDFILCSGGISVGDYDYVGKAMKALEVEEVFYKVAQKPGKPLYFGKKDQVMLFGLPGNPASSLTTFYIYVKPTLQALKDAGQVAYQWESGVLQETKKAPSRGVFLKAYEENGNVFLLNHQSSAMLRSFAEANVLAYIPAESEVAKGGVVQFVRV